jgi:hypothetical protein
VSTLNPYKVSPSRVNTLLSCGTSFEMRYVDKLPAERSGSAALFGSVVHKALEDWGTDRSQRLLPLMQNAWEAVTEGTMVAEFVQAYKRLSIEAIKTKHEITTRRPEIKNVVMTKDWKQSNIAKRISLLLEDYIPRLEADEATIWQFTENDPLPALYDESLPLARRYEERWKHLPNVLLTEFRADVPWKKWIFDCWIDTIEVVTDKATGQQYLGILDYKTYRRKPPMLKDWRQSAMYYVGVLEMFTEGRLPINPEYLKLPLLVGVDYVRWADTSDWNYAPACPPRRFWKFGHEDRVRLERELQRYSNIVERGDFLPAEKNRNADFCDYPSRCCLRTNAQTGGSCEPVGLSL